MGWTGKHLQRNIQKMLADMPGEARDGFDENLKEGALGSLQPNRGRMHVYLMIEYYRNEAFKRMATRRVKWK